MPPPPDDHARGDAHPAFVLHGRQAARRYALIRTDRDWLLHLNQDQPS